MRLLRLLQGTPTLFPSLRSPESFSLALYVSLLGWRDSSPHLVDVVATLSPESVMLGQAQALAVQCAGAKEHGS